MNTNTQAGGNTDLLSAVYSIEIRNEEKISESDRAYCQKKQDQLYASLNQLDHWYGIFKAETDKYAGAKKIEYEKNGSIKSEYLLYGYRSDRKSYTDFEFWPFKELNKVVKLRSEAICAFAGDITGYFNKTYNVSIATPDIDKNSIATGFYPTYTTYVDLVIEHLGGRGFREVAEQELVQRCLESVKQRLYGNLKPEIKGSTISLPNFIRYRDYSWEKENRIDYEYFARLKSLCAGIVFAVTGSIHAHPGYIAAFNSDCVDFTQWYTLITMEPISMKFFKNGRIDVKFGGKDTAEKCWKSLQLDTLNPRNSE